VITVDRQEEFVLRTLEERDIRFVRLWFTDVLGTLKSVAVAPAELEGAFADGIGFDGSAIEGFARVYEADMIARPDPSTFQLLPWRGEYPGVARMFCDILLPDGSPSYADPRWVLKRNLSRASELGFTFYAHPEIEFFLLRERPEPATSRGPSTPAATTTTRRTASRTTSAAPRSRCWNPWASRWSTATTRARPGSRRSTCATPTR
jgi:glutamine synthetase